MAKLNIVGVGPGSTDFVTPAARKAVQQADVVVGSQRSINILSSDIKGKAVVFTAKNLHDTLKEAAKSLKEGKNVALLSVGDPGFSGLLHTVKESGLFQESEVEVIPGVSSIQACAARLKINWEGVSMFTFHDGKVTEKDKKELLASLKRGKTVMVLPDQKAFTIENIADFLVQSGLDKKLPVFVCENLTLPEERIIVTRLGEMSGLMFGSLSIMVIKQ